MRLRLEAGEGLWHPEDDVSSCASAQELAATFEKVQAVMYRDYDTPEYIARKKKLKGE